MEIKLKLTGLLRKGVTFLLIGLVIYAGGRLTYNRVTALRSSPPVTEAAGLPVKTARVTSGPIQETLTYVGTVRSDHEVFLAARITATILRQEAREGDFVRAGTPLVILDDKELVASTNTLKQKVANAQENVTYWQKEVARNKSLYEQGAIPAKQYEDTRYALEQAEGNLKVAEAMLEESLTNLRNVTLSTPVDGVVTDVAAYAGDLAVPGKPLVTIADVKRLKVEVKLVEGDLPKVQVGTKVMLQMRTGSVKPIISQISKIHPAADPVSRTTVVEIPLPGEVGKDLRPGNSMDAIFILKEKKDAILVPRQAVIEDGDKTYIFVVADGKAQRREIKKGIVNNDYVEALGGVGKNTVVAITNLTELYDGRTVYLYDRGQEQ
ncbi:efflux RND transporter periplasmic adaptor subunit [Neomoorella mulderi]|uniref:Putative efflux system component YknX n=1 Tax=Moorella mulderi DSM 14980 TaxID=1122241 RepID=A0A151AUC1_9FIRM|nr:efflux RND transporter periplasmic adaptor subunit [Moorella mulderi]KYH31172.1 putative efflux system component YknX [Moorella mulderi DSM 14980]